MTTVDHAGARHRPWPARIAAAAGVAGIAVHLVLAGEHAGHAPAVLAGLAVLALVCLPCGVQLLRRPGDRAAWMSLLALSGLMMLLHLGMRPEGAMLAVVLAVPALQAVLGAVAFLHRYG
ncbi:hypothetical protein GCM10010112_28490 [Actinoplanes lobatus]|uniref:Uncharacterized protein n=1 Tax=Actinoplanes lobatus TaxID=113568 RepID=A0A7W7HQ75_9ACTN|nr:hypothetical protein [Actinoplanes lobatus]MBB4754559.1 hypothetical protein [Actinoplanes lobatus]GGN66270.1 hypothetical protein GCM10010112_28490 [Actinoplanes lobatus]GIE45906.1 hypothetical protein Alo02nite_88040 [Actinoplanes lobatus]